MWCNFKKIYQHTWEGINTDTDLLVGLSLQTEAGSYLAMAAKGWYSPLVIIANYWGVTSCK